MPIRVASSEREITTGSRVGTVVVPLPAPGGPDPPPEPVLEFPLLVLEFSLPVLSFVAISA
jgi:hypothetical protein